ncbi:protein of unknown function [Pseudorhizobium banfieldiae]|uniref:Uncharacterized protein n=1 Tax=Pseudorhizobium banfieldiae TaxID=1125847 RepID=L0NE89_9HYPH|nr:hypothetical protein [Pseudorhizobium banfieldiae]CAD6606294.1 late control protein D [arsenite-oxidising bacterium NT-25]CCF19179.1 protein of unknown function [Pseudorhizobium banfieldiae]
MPTPVFYIKADGKDVTDNLRGVGITMTITDSEGLSADTLQLEIDDIDGSVEAPRTGVVLNPIGGYEGNLRDFGLFIVDSVTYTGWPQKISVDAKSVAAKSLAKQREPKAYPKKDFPTYGDIFQEVASSIGLTLKMDSKLKAIENQYEAQAEEDGLEFLTRISGKINASVTVKAMNLVVAIKGAGRSASGAQLDRIRVAKGYNLLDYSVTERDEPKHSEVEATYYDRDKNERASVSVSTGLEGPKFLIRSAFQNEAEAKEAAESQAKELTRMQGEATFTIDGDPFAMAEAWADVTGCRTRVDGEWRIRTVTHNFSSGSPYTNTLQCGTTSEEGGDE